jgi:hypothetical protein
MATIDRDNMLGAALIPESGSNILKLPMSLDSSNGSDQSNAIRYLLSGVFSAGYILYAISLLFNTNMGIISKIFSAVFWFVVVSLVVRFLFLKEKSLRKQYTTAEADGNNLDLSLLWGISSVDDDAFHMVTFRGGTLGVFMELVPDTIVGKPDDDEDRNYECIASAYRKAEHYGIKIRHYDVMDFLGEDARLDKANVLLSQRCSNPTIKNTVSRMYNFIASEMSTRIYTRDVYRLTVKDKTEISFMDNILEIRNEFLKGNYREGKLLNQTEIGDVLETFYGFKGFSVNDAISDSYRHSSLNGVIPLVGTYPNGREEVYNKLELNKTTHKSSSKKTTKHSKNNKPTLIEL